MAIEKSHIRIEHIHIIRTKLEADDLHNDWLVNLSTPKADVAIWQRCLSYSHTKVDNHNIASNDQGGATASSVKVRQALIVLLHRSITTFASRSSPAPYALSTMSLTQASTCATSPALCYHITLTQRNW